MSADGGLTTISEALEIEWRGNECRWRDEENCKSALTWTGMEGMGFKTAKYVSRETAGLITVWWSRPTTMWMQCVHFFVAELADDEDNDWRTHLNNGGVRVQNIEK